MTRQLFIWTVFLGLTASCGQRSLPDYYKVFKETQSPGITGTNVLMCKLGCTNDPVVDYVKSIDWNESLMYITQQTAGQENYYIIKSKNKQLACCNQDSLIGPLTFKEFNQTIINLKMPKTLPNHNTY